VATLHVAGNRIVRVSGSGPFAADRARFFAEDPGRCNIAEFGLGLNEHAVVVPGERYLLEEEKVEGHHWAFGRSDHFGGVIGPQASKPLDHVTPPLAKIPTPYRAGPIGCRRCARPVTSVCRPSAEQISTRPRSAPDGLTVSRVPPPRESSHDRRGPRPLRPDR